MERAVKYIKNAVVVLISGYTVFAAVSVILAVLSLITWEMMGEVLLKAAMIFGVLLAANVVIAALVGLTPKSTPTKK